MKYYLVHGYGKSLDISEKIIPANLGFYIFNEDISRGEAQVFDWAVRVDRRLFAPFNPIAQLKLYFAERAWAADEEWQQRLFEELERVQPEIVVCHSRGCRFFLNTIQQFGMPSSVKKVVFVQADLDQNVILLHAHIVLCVGN